MNSNYDGQFFFALIAALILSVLLGLLVGHKYKKRILALMQMGDKPNDGSETIHTRSIERLTTSSSVPFGLSKQNYQAVWFYRIIVLFIGTLLSLIITFFYLESAVPDKPFSLNRTFQVFLANAWVIVASIGLLERWSSLKILIFSLTYAASVTLLIFLREGISLFEVISWLFGQQLLLLPFVFILISSKLRTLGPYLFVIFFLLICTSLAGVHVLDTSVGESEDNSWIIDLAHLTNAYVVMLLFIIVPWLIAFFPIESLAKKIAKLYEDKVFSEYLYLLISLWTIVLLFQALMLSHGLSTTAYTLLVSLLIIPLVFFIIKPFLLPKHQPPTLLILRVFREDDGIKKIFDKVLEKWRYTGNTLMIGGEDLAIQTLEPNELFGFLNGRLQDRFISSESDLERKISQIDLSSDPDGRYRVNEFLCFDTTWKLALDASVLRSNAVLMDLRDYHAGRKGCSYELDAIANSHHLQKVIILTNTKTDTVTAKKLLLDKVNKTTWVDENESKGSGLEANILAALLA